MSRLSASSRRSSADVVSSSYMVSSEQIGSSLSAPYHHPLPPPPRSPAARHPGSGYPPRSPAHLDLPFKSPARHIDSHKCHLGKGGLHIGMPRVKLRFCSLLFLVARMKRSCGRAVMLAVTPPPPTCTVCKTKGGVAANAKLARGISGSYSCGSSYPDAVVDCIDYIKKSATTEPSPTEC